jgi:GxxExxY protein
LTQNTLNDLTHSVIGAAIEVHRELGPGFLESVYEEALTLKLSSRGIPFLCQHIITVVYKDHHIGESRLDLLVDNCLIVEMKAVDTLLPIHTAQIISCLKMTSLSLGLLINFNVKMLKQGVKRIILD